MAHENANCRPRQAVVLIHGIGEQRPMETLRAFVKALVVDHAAIEAPSESSHSEGKSNPGDSTPKDRLYYSKPDRLSGSYELRRLKVHRVKPNKLTELPEGFNNDWPDTDFYEYYWAHQMYGTTLSHVISWAWRLPWHGLRFLLRPRGEKLGSASAADYSQTRKLVYRVWAFLLLAVVLGAVVWSNKSWIAAKLKEWSPEASLAEFAGLAALVGLLLAVVPWKALGKNALGTFLDFIGDAARYFDVAPKNVARRYDILRGGIQLLKDLHEDRDETSDKIMFRYGRIVLVGHSLGGVIGYDILRHYWAAVNGRLPIGGMDNEIRALEAFTGSNVPPPPDPKSTAGRYTTPEDYRENQRRAFARLNQELPSGIGLEKAKVLPSGKADSSDETHLGETDPREKTPARWIVSDFVTMGSPLTHAPLLLANGIDDKDEGLKRKIELRELSTCPPDRGRTLNPGRFVVPIWAEAEMIHRDRSILHHATCFAITRWTNLWFAKDWIGGAVTEPFGNAIDDFELTESPWLFFMAHTSY